MIALTLQPDNLELNYLVGEYFYKDNDKDIFVHFSALENSGLEYLKNGEKLTFEVVSSDKGPSAVNLQKTDGEVSHSHLKVVK